MTKEEVQSRYKGLILPENKNPYHFEVVAAETTVEAFNPMCGDKYELFLDGKSVSIETVHFHGIGCALSKASTSLLLREIEHKSKEEVMHFIEAFISAEDANKLPDHFSEALKTLVELKNFGGRVDCIHLSWKALLDQLSKSA